MQVISTNIGEKKAIQWQGKEVFTGIYKYPVTESIILGKHDVEKDNVIDRRYHGGIDKACYLYSCDHYNYWKGKYPDLNWQWGMFGENLSIEGMDESKIHIGDVFQIGTAIVQITQPRQPCFKLGIRFANSAVVKQFVKAELPGAYVRVIKEGVINSGDRLILTEICENNFTLKEIFHLIYNTNSNVDKVKKAIDIPELAESCRNDLIKYAGL